MGFYLECNPEFYPVPPAAGGLKLLSAGSCEWRATGVGWTGLPDGLASSTKEPRRTPRWWWWWSAWAVGRMAELLTEMQRERGSVDEAALHAVETVPCAWSWLQPGPAEGHSTSPVLLGCCSLRKGLGSRGEWPALPGRSQWSGTSRPLSVSSRYCACWNQPKLRLHGGCRCSKGPALRSGSWPSPCPGLCPWACATPPRVATATSPAPSPLCPRA